MTNHLVNKPDHLDWLIQDRKSLQHEVAILKEAVTAWRDLARERAVQAAKNEHRIPWPEKLRQAKEDGYWERTNGAS